MFVFHEALTDLICDVDRLGFYHFYNKYKISDKTYRSSKELERARPVPDMNLIITGDSKSDIFHSIENNIGYLGLTRDGPLIPQADTRYRCQSSHVFIGFIRNSFWYDLKPKLNAFDEITFLDYDESYLLTTKRL